jgi:hypothetical protein
MPRQSKLTVAARFRPTMPGDRPLAPDHLPADAREEWRQVVGRMPAGWFNLEALPILEALCRLIIEARDQGAQLYAAPPEDRRQCRAEYRRTVALMSSLAHRLRLTPQAQRWPTVAAHSTGTSSATPAKPWEAEDDPAPVELREYDADVKPPWEDEDGDELRR